MTLRFHYKQTEIDAMPTLPHTLPTVFLQIPWVVLKVLYKRLFEVVTLSRCRM